MLALPIANDVLALVLESEMTTTLALCIVHSLSFFRPEFSFNFVNLENGFSFHEKLIDVKSCLFIFLVKAIELGLKIGSLFFLWYIGWQVCFKVINRSFVEYKWLFFYSELLFFDAFIPFCVFLFFLKFYSDFVPE